MLHLQRTAIDLDSLLQSPDYSALIHSFTLPHLTSPSSKTRWVAAEARWENELIALALAEINPLHRALFHSLVVKPAYQHQGIGRQLFVFMEDLLVQQENIGTIEVQYEQTDPVAPALEKTLEFLNWPPAKMFLIRCHFDVATFNPPWLHYSYRLPPSMSFFSWNSLTRADRSHIEYLAEQGHFLPYLSPLHDEKTIDQKTSIGLRQNGQLVGWSITRKLDPSTICFHSLYIEKKLLNTGYGIQILIESMKRVKTSSIPQALFEIELSGIDPSWWQFVKKRLMPIAKKIDRIKRTMRVFAVFLD